MSEETNPYDASDATVSHVDNKGEKKTGEKKTGQQWIADRAEENRRRRNAHGNLKPGQGAFWDRLERRNRGRGRGSFKGERKW